MKKDFYISVSVDNIDTTTRFVDQKINFEDIHMITGTTHYSNISFKDGYRKSMNFRGLSLIMLDIDNGDSIPEVIEKLGTQKALIVTTKSHQLSMKGTKTIEPCDRYRLILPLDEPITDPVLYKKVITALIKEFKADPHCSDLARMYYHNPRQEVHYVN